MKRFNIKKMALGGSAKPNLDYRDSRQGTVGTSVLGTAGTGAGIGTAIAPGLGTIIGGAAGALVGLGAGLLGRGREKRMQKQQYNENLQNWQAEQNMIKDNQLAQDRIALQDFNQSGYEVPRMYKYGGGIPKYQTGGNANIDNNEPPTTTPTPTILGKKIEPTSIWENKDLYGILGGLIGAGIIAQQALGKDTYSKRAAKYIYNKNWVPDFLGYKAKAELGRQISALEKRNLELESIIKNKPNISTKETSDAVKNATKEYKKNVLMLKEMNPRYSFSKPSGSNNPTISQMLKNIEIENSQTLPSSGTTYYNQGSTQKLLGEKQNLLQEGTQKRLPSKTIRLPETTQNIIPSSNVIYNMKEGFTPNKIEGQVPKIVNPESPSTVKPIPKSNEIKKFSAIVKESKLSPTDESKIMSGFKKGNSVSKLLTEISNDSNLGNVAKLETKILKSGALKKFLSIGAILASPAALMAQEMLGSEEVGRGSTLDKRTNEEKKIALRPILGTENYKRQLEAEKYKKELEESWKPSKKRFANK